LNRLTHLISNPSNDITGIPNDTKTFYIEKSDVATLTDIEVSIFFVWSTL